jgi:dihydroorotase-like cyclic amidohydrolase
MQKCGYSLETAWKMCSVNPARIAGIDLPMLKEGDEATFVIYHSINQTRLIFRGE